MFRIIYPRYRQTPIITDEQIQYLSLMSYDVCRNYRVYASVLCYALIQQCRHRHVYEAPYCPVLRGDNSLNLLI